MEATTNGGGSASEEVIVEGKAKIFKRPGVFYNKVQEFNRDLSVLAVHTYLKNSLWKKSKKVFIKDKVTILDALSATGLRSIRYALECRSGSPLPVEIVANDISKAAIATIQANVAANGVAEAVIVNEDDASLMMYKRKGSGLGERLTVVDLDPYGSPAPFLDAAIQTVADGGLLMVTCTDMAVLCGNHGEACYAKYGAVPLKAKFCHEMALRILLQSLESHANRYGRYIVPLLSLSIDFYVRIFVQVFTSPFETRKSTSKLSYIYICTGCESFQLQPLTHQKFADPSKPHYLPSKVLFDSTCELCGRGLQIGGPFWSAEIHCPAFVKQMKAELRATAANSENSDTSASSSSSTTTTPAPFTTFGTYRRMEGLLEVVSEELIGCPLYYHLDRLCSLARTRMPPAAVVRAAILSGGYQASVSHALKNSLKTNAPNEYVWAVLQALVRAEAEGGTPSKLQPGEPVHTILQRDFGYGDTVSLEVTEEAAAAEPGSKARHLLRYQVNPEAGWGPKARPNNEKAETKRKNNQGKNADKKGIKRTKFVEENDENLPVDDLGLPSGDTAAAAASQNQEAGGEEQ